MATSDYLKIWLQFNNDDDITFDFCGNSWTAFNNPEITRKNAFYGSALKLEGGTAGKRQYIALENEKASFVLGGDDFTIDFWCAADSDDSGISSDIFGLANYSSVNTSYTFLLRRYNNNFVDCIYNSNTPIASFQIPLNQLFHCAIVYQHDKNSISFFINGNLVATANKSFSRVTYQYFRIGAANFYSNQRAGFKGTIDEFRVFDGVALWTEDFTLPTVADYLDYLDYIDYEGYSVFPVAVNIDTAKHTQKNIQLQLDTLRDLPLILKLDTGRETQKTIAPLFDSSRKLHNYFDFTFDTVKKISNPVQLQLDTLRDLPLILRLDTKLRIKNVVSFNLDTSRFSGNVLDFQADFDTFRRTINATDFSADTKLQLIQSVELELDIERIVERTVKFACDLIRKIPYPFIVEPAFNLLPIDTPVTAGIQSLSISISEGQIVDQLNFVTINHIDILEQVKGQFLDYKFNFRVENISVRDGSTDLPISTCSCCSDIDELLFTQMAYQLPQSQYNGGLTYYFTTSSSTNTDSAEILNSSSTQTVEEPKCKASAHALKIASKLGKIPVLLFDDFISTVDTSPRNVTYQDLIDEIFLWTSKIPHKMINVFLRDDKLFFIQRGHEQNIFDLSAAKIGKDFVVDKKIVRTQWGTNATTSTRWIPVLGNEIGADDGDGEEKPALLRMVRTVQDKDGNEIGVRHVYTNGSQWSWGQVLGLSVGWVATDVYYEYDRDGDVIKTTTITTGGVMKNDVNTGSGAPLPGEETVTHVEVKNKYDYFQGEKYLSSETTNTFEGSKVTESKTVHHAPSGMGQQHTFSVDNEGNIGGSVTTASRQTEKPTPYVQKIHNNYWSERKKPNSYTVEQNGNTYYGDGAGAYAWKDGKKYEVVGYERVSQDIEKVPANTLYDSSFPVDDEMKKLELTREMIWLNRKIQETVSLDVYDFPHIFDFNDKIIFFGNTYHLQSNSVTHYYNMPNKQSLQLIRWYGLDGSTPTYGFTGMQKWVLVSRVGSLMR